MADARGLTLHMRAMLHMRAIRLHTRAMLYSVSGHCSVETMELLFFSLLSINSGKRTIVADK